MPLDRLALIFVAVVACLWAGVMVLGMVAALPWGLPGLIAFGAIGYLLWRVVSDRCRVPKTTITKTTFSSRTAGQS